MTTAAVPTFALNDAYLTIQGEGALTGTPMYLVRLHGCDIGCPFCDTKETWGALGRRADQQVPALEDALGTSPRWASVTLDLLLNYLDATKRAVRWILLTGGEPCAQPIHLLAEAAVERGWNVALETSGTYPLFSRRGFAHVCVSPKIGMPGGRRIVPETVLMADELKFVVGKPADLENILTFLSGFRPDKLPPRISLQPMSMNKKATALCVDAALRYGWAVSIQTHKVMEVR